MLSVEKKNLKQSTQQINSKKRKFDNIIKEKNSDHRNVQDKTRNITNHEVTDESEDDNEEIEEKKPIGIDMDKVNSSLLDKARDYKYNIIYVDPPWQYQKNKNKNKIFKGLAIDHYECMSIEDLKKLRVQEICEKDAILIMWVTGPFLFKSSQLFEAWGFEYINPFKVWGKTCNGNICGPRLGTYTRQTTEFVLFGRKGKNYKFTFKRKNIYNLFLEDPTEHSKKPELVRENIDELFMNLPKIELFARESKNKNWEYWGNETKKFGSSSEDTKSTRKKQLELQKVIKDWVSKRQSTYDKKTKMTFELNSHKDVDDYLKKRRDMLK